MDLPLSVTGVGMITAVGLNAEQSCAAIRCGIARFAESTTMVDRFGQPIVSANPEVSGLGDDAAVRCTDLAVRSARQAMRQLSPVDVSRRRVDIYFATTDTAELRGLATEETLSGILAGAQELAFFCLPFGNAGGLEALRRAQQNVAIDPERLAVVIGYGNLCTSTELCRLERSHRLKTPTRQRGVIPAEAAACVLLESPEYARSRGRQEYASVRSTSITRENATVETQDPCLAEGLTEAVHRSLQAAGWEGETVGRVYCDLNGEEYRAHEWMLMLSRTGFGCGPTHPADCIGDVGAAFGPLLTGIASVAMYKGYARTARALVFCSSESGLRGAACLATAS